MSKTLTEVDTFTASIVVPEGTDSRNTAAEDVESIAQRLANRTKNLNLHAARKDVANVFTQPQTIPDIAGDVDFADDVAIAGTLDVTGLLSCDDIDSTGDVFATDDVIAGDEFQYATPPVRTKEINPAAGNNGGGSATLIGNGQTALIPPAARWFVIVNAPHGALLSAVQVKLSLALGDAADCDLLLYRRTAPNYGTNSVPSYVLVASSGTTSLTPNATVSIGASFGGLTVNKNETYTIVVENKSGSTDDFNLASIEYTFTDPGPRNH